MLSTFDRIPPVTSGDLELVMPAKIVLSDECDMKGITSPVGNVVYTPSSTPAIYILVGVRDWLNMQRLIL